MGKEQAQFHQCSDVLVQAKIICNKVCGKYCNNHYMLDRTTQHLHCTCFIICHSLPLGQLFSPIQKSIQM